MSNNESHRKGPVPGQILFSVEQAAQVLGISARLIWDFIKCGVVPVRRVGVRVLIHRRDLEKFALKDHATKLTA